MIASFRGTARRNSAQRGIGDERAAYVRWSKSSHPIDVQTYLDAIGPAPTLAREAISRGDHIVLTEGGETFPVHPMYRDVPIVYFAGRLGTGGMLTPVNGIVVDTLGLANPVGARITITEPGMAGHEKSLPWSWMHAEYSDPAIDFNDVRLAVAVRAARHALKCGSLAELIASVREPLTFDRFWRNIVGSVRRTRLVVPADPIDAEWKFCAAATYTPRITTSSSFESDGWSAQHIADGRLNAGYASEPGSAHWIELRFPRRWVCAIVVHPATGGYPRTLRIQTWNGTHWIDRVTKADASAPETPETFTFPPVITDGVRLEVTTGGERLNLYEIEWR
jgi:hypothetical protein